MPEQQEIKKVKCTVSPGKTLDGIYAGGSYSAGDEVELHPDVAKFYADGGIVEINEAPTAKPVLPVSPKPQEGIK